MAVRDPSVSARAAALADLLFDTRALRRDLLAAELRHASRIARVTERHRASARNLVHYVEFRRHDIRDLQSRLADHGLTSLGRTESQVLAGIDALIDTLTALCEGTAAAAAAAHASRAVTEPPATGPEVLEANTERLLGARPAGRGTRIMVTMPSEAADDADLVRRMVRAGMDVARINCAHDDAERWAAMARNIRNAAAAERRTCLIAADLAGPKLRTGPIEPAPGVVRARPHRDRRGTVLRPGLVRLDEPGTQAPTAAGVDRVAVDTPGWAAALRPGDRIRLSDARGSRRTLLVEAADEGGCLASTTRTTYLVEGTLLDAATGARVAALPQREQAHLVLCGDRIRLTRDLAPAPVIDRDLHLDGEPPQRVTHTIGCTLPEVFDDATAGQRVSFDDGRIGGVIDAVGEGELTVLVTAAAPTGTRLKTEKGINLPDTRLRIGAITEQDARDLEFVIREADIVDLSFVRQATDVRTLHELLVEGGGDQLDIVLKIETAGGFEALPQIMLEAMRWEDVGVMIARGDLAVEVGFERLAEVQEEILWICEAAHVPVIWATQVLDTLARTGVPSRAEVTDAAMAQRAECVMLNKGPYIVEAIETLDSILGRMGAHANKKSSLLRRLRSWDLELDPV